MKAFFISLFGTDNINVVISGAILVLFGVLLRTLYNFTRNVKSKDKPAVWWGKKAFAFLLGCLLMRFLNVFVAVDNVDYLYMVGFVFGFFPDVAIHYLFEAKRRVRGNAKFKDRN